MNLLLKRFSYVTFFFCRIQNNPYPCARGFSSETTGSKTRHENMRGNTGIHADDFTDGNHGKDMFLHVNYLCKPYLCLLPQCMCYIGSPYIYFLHTLKERLGGARC